MLGVDGVLAWLAQAALDVVDTLGYAGLFALMALESMVAPVPSEAVLPPAGFLAARGEMSFALAFAAATAGTLAGSLLSYAMGYYGIRPLLERYGRFVLVHHRHLDLAEGFFHRRSAGVAVFLGRFVPVVRHLVSIPAGSARMPLAPFCLATVLGGGTWNLTLLYAGFALGENWHAIEPILRDAKLVTVALVAAAAVGVLAWIALRRRAARTAGALK